MKITLDLSIPDAARLLEWAQTNVSAEITLTTDPAQVQAPLPVRRPRRNRLFWLAVKGELEAHPELTYTEIARRTGVSQTSVREIAHGKHWSCKPETHNEEN